MKKFLGWIVPSLVSALISTAAVTISIAEPTKPNGVTQKIIDKLQEKESWIRGSDFRGTKKLISKDRRLKIAQGWFFATVFTRINNKDRIYEDWIEVNSISLKDRRLINQKITNTLTEIEEAILSE